MKKLNKLIYLNKKIYLAHIQYNLKIKSLISFKKDKVFLLNLFYNIIFLKKALKILEKILEVRGIIFLIGFNMTIKIKSPYIRILKKDFNLGKFSNLLSKKHKTPRLPDLLILWNQPEGIDYIKKINTSFIPTIAFLNTNQKFDNIEYPVFVNTNENMQQFCLMLIFNSILNSKYTEKKKR